MADSVNETVWGPSTPGRSTARTHYYARRVCFTVAVWREDLHSPVGCSRTRRHQTGPGAYRDHFRTIKGDNQDPDLSDSTLSNRLGGRGVDAQPT